MIRALITEIIKSDSIEEATIILENNKTYVVPLNMLPNGAKEYDLIQIENGKSFIDPETDDFLSKLEESIFNMTKDAKE